MFSLINKVRKIKRQDGLVTVEFAIVGLVFLTVIFMVIEFGRMLFTWNVLDEITRRGARLAAVCPVTLTPNVGSPGIFERSTLTGNPINIAVGEFVIEYLEDDGDVITDPFTNFDNIRFVRARIVGYQHQTVFPIDLLLDAPAFETTLPAESLGISPPGTGVTTC